MLVEFNDNDIYIYIYGWMCNGTILFVSFEKNIY